MQGHYSKVFYTYLFMEWVYSLHIVTSVVDGALWSTSCTRLTLMFIVTVQCTR
jgi:hypothetical protein